jgi:2-polyprenyl-3-methyl-5-hydroxy-6-metoxy-1,4-benzoquinol methylase
MSSVIETVPCNLCGCREERRRFQPRRSPGPVVQCSRCGLVYVNPRDTGVLFSKGSDRMDFARVVGTRDGHQMLLAYLRDQAPWRARNFAEAVHEISGFVSPPGKLLDVGCHCGIFLNEARKIGFEVCGVEPIAELARYGREELGISVYQGVLREATFRENSFDVITYFQVLEHVPDPRQELLEAHSLLRPRGLLVVEVPRIDCATVRLLRGHHRHFSEWHLYFFSIKTLSALLEQSGFQVRRLDFPPRKITLGFLARLLGRTSPLLSKIMLKGLRLSRLENCRMAFPTRDVLRIFALKAT